MTTFLGYGRDVLAVIGAVVLAWLLLAIASVAFLGHELRKARRL
jgi:hypothetical protein